MKKAFTLVELLVVIAVIGILSAIITPNLLNARNSARIAAGQRFDSSVYHSIGDYLVGEWMFDVPSSSLIDTSGMGNTGSTTTSPTYYQTGGYNSKGAFSFDGTDDYITVGTSANFNFTSDFTISAWIKTTQSAANRQVVSKGTFNSGTDPGYGLWVNGGRIRPMINDSVQGKSVTDGDLVNNDAWHHVAGVFDRDGNLTAYVDGKTSGTSVSISDIGTCYDALDSLKIGSRNQSDFLFAGYIDDVRIYSAALSAEDVMKLYAEGAEVHYVSIKP